MYAWSLVRSPTTPTPSLSPAQYHPHQKRKKRMPQIRALLGQHETRGGHFFLAHPSSLHTSLSSLWLFRLLCTPPLSCVLCTIKQCCCHSNKMDNGQQHCEWLYIFLALLGRELWYFFYITFFFIFFGVGGMVSF